MDRPTQMMKQEVNANMYPGISAGSELEKYIFKLLKHILTSSFCLQNVTNAVIYWTVRNRTSVTSVLVFTN